MDASIDYEIRHAIERAGYEIISISLKGRNTYEVAANKLFAVSQIEQQPLYLPLLTTLTVIQEQETAKWDFFDQNPDAEKQAMGIFSTLNSRDEIEGLGDNLRPSYRIEKNRAGQSVIRRFRISGI
jgi:hypothetical protein